MWGPGHSALFLALIWQLIPQPGDSQGAAQYKCSNDCKEMLTATDEGNISQTLVKFAKVTHCGSNIVKFKLPRTNRCGDLNDVWIMEVVKCIENGRVSCLKPSDTQKDYSKGSKEIPLTTTQASPTSTVKTAPSLILSTQTWSGGTLKPSETEELGSTQKILEPTTGPNSNQNMDPLHGNGFPTKKEDEKSKMNKMTIAIISLILIVLLMTAVGMYIWCRKMQFPQCRKHCTEESVKYELTPSITSDLSESGP